MNAYSSDGIVKFFICPERHQGSECPHLSKNDMSRGIGAIGNSADKRILLWFSHSVFEEGAMDNWARHTEKLSNPTDGSVLDGP
jgi:hypothetical protein